MSNEPEKLWCEDCRKWVEPRLVSIEHYQGEQEPIIEEYIGCPEIRNGKVCGTPKDLLLKQGEDYIPHIQP